MCARFAAAAAAGDPAGLAARCIAGLAPVDGATLGFVYVTEPAAAALPELLRRLSRAYRHPLLGRRGRARRLLGGERNFRGAGRCGDDRGVAAGRLPHLRRDRRPGLGPAAPARRLDRESGPALALVHADPRCPDLTKAAVDAAAASGAFLVGGLVSHRCETRWSRSIPG